MKCILNLICYLANESGDENEEEQIAAKKKVITIPLRFKPIEIPRGGPAGSRGGPRRVGSGGGGGRYRDRPNRDDQTRCTVFQRSCFFSIIIFYS